MKDEEDEVGFDLSAWEAPPPPAGIADAVVARITAPTPAAAIEPEPPSRKRWWIAGGALTAAAAIAAIAFGVRASDHETGSGAVATAKPSHLELGGTALDLEANTEVWWVRDGKRIVAMQPRGTATWKVAAEDELVIDAGATVASVRASGASLRVEVEMNLSDARLIGTSAATAAAVALVTVIVYEGHVRVTGGDRTVEVAAGSTVEIAPNKPPMEPDRVAGLEKRLQSQIELLKLENELLRKKFAAGAATVAPADPKRDVFADVEKVMRGANPALQRCGKGTTGKYLVTIVVHDDGQTKPQIEFSDQDEVKESVESCVKSVVSNLIFAPTTGGAFERLLTFPEAIAVAPKTPTRPTKPDTSGDFGGNPFPPVKPDTTKSNICADKAAVEKIFATGETHMGNGSFAAALSTFESILKCPTRRPVVSAAYLSACRARNFPKAKVYFHQLGKESLAQICMKEGFDPRK